MLLINGWNRTGSLLSGKNTNKWLVISVEVILVVLLMQQLAKITWSVIEQYLTSPMEFPALSSSAFVPANKTESHQYSQLQSLQLFGQTIVASTVAAIPETTNIQDIPVSRLRATVTGLVAHPVAARALAVIDSGGRQKTYRIDDEIYKSSASVEAIYWDRVIINNRGKQEALLLYPNEKTAGQPPSKNRVAQPPVAELKALRKQVLSNPASLMEMVSISPVRVGGELKGYRINPKQHQQLFSQAGLKPNDLATAINGYDLTDPAQAMEVLNRLKTLEQVALTVERQGQLYQIDLSL